MTTSRVKSLFYYVECWKGDPDYRATGAAIYAGADTTWAYWSTEDFVDLDHFKNKARIPDGREVLGCNEIDKDLVKIE